jgi:glutamate-5-semialdehyde dehydrogenase
LLSDSPEAHEHFYKSVDAPFVGDGFTRWVDGQYALQRPELGLSNWERGRLLGRGAILAGDSVFTIRTRVSGTSSGRPKS